jgi:RNase P/RNase MRP subunit p29
MFSPEKFYITVGDRYKRGFVIPKENEHEQHLEAYRKSGYRVLAVPKDFKTNFLADYDIALRDIAGISVTGAMGFITQDSITPNVTSARKNPFFEDILVIGIRDNDTIENHCHPEVVDKHIKSLPMNIHIDFAEVSDRIGISGVVQDGMKNVLDLDTERRVMLPFYRQVFQVGIEAPSGDRMSFQKVINFMVWLRRTGFNVNLISTDQFQSSYVRETLAQQGFAVEKISVDVSEDPYIGLRNLLQDQRLELIKNQKQEDELVKLQRLNNRIDHPQNGSKDLSDALCGACWAHIQHQDQIKPSINNMASVISSVNGRPSTPKSRMPSVFGPYIRR